MVELTAAEDKAADADTPDDLDLIGKKRIAENSHYLCCYYDQYCQCLNYLIEQLAAERIERTLERNNEKSIN
jgi:hypothetical protein